MRTLEGIDTYSSPSIALLTSSIELEDMRTLEGIDTLYANKIQRDIQEIVRRYENP